jgi:hypothetical protein
MREQFLLQDHAGFKVSGAVCARVIRMSASRAVLPPVRTKEQEHFCSPVGGGSAPRQLHTVVIFDVVALDCDRSVSL